MNRTTLIIIFAIGLVAIAGFIGILTGFLRQPGDDTTNTTNTVTNQPLVNAIENPTNVVTDVQPGLDEGSSTSLDPVSAEELELRAALESKSLVFVTTYGTFSNQNSNEHLQILLDQTTTPLRSQFEQSIAATENAPVGEYHGYSTTAVSADIRALTAVTATVVVTSQRIEHRDGKEDRMFSQSVTLIFKNVDDAWRVAELNWQTES